MKALQDVSVQDLPVAGYPRHWGSPRRGSTWGRRWASWRRWRTLGRLVSKTSLSSPLPGSPLRREFHNSSKSLWGKKSCFINFAAFGHLTLYYAVCSMHTSIFSACSLFRARFSGSAGIPQLHKLRLKGETNRASWFVNFRPEITNNPLHALKQVPRDATINCWSGYNLEALKDPE